MAAPQTSPFREVHLADAIEWLRAHPLGPDRCIVTSMPDVSEMRAKTFDQWKTWFVDASEFLCDAVHEESVAIFYQTDIKHEGRWVDKAHLVHQGADRAGSSCLWHKIVCRTEPDKVTFGRPAYAHVMCFSKSRRLTAPESSADVLGSLGTMTWKRAMGVNACRAIASFVAERTECRTVVDPFCGHGTMLAAANEAGLSAVGIDRSPKRLRKADALTLGATVPGGL